MPIYRMLSVLAICCFHLIAFGQEIKLSEQELRERYLESIDLIGAHQYEEAAELLSQCYTQDPDNIDYLSRIAYCNMQMGRYGDAKMFYNEILKLDSLNTIALGSLGSIAEKESNYSRAWEYYQQLTAIDSTNSYYFKRLAFTALRLDNTIGGVAYFLKAHQLSRADIEVIHHLSKLYLALGAFDLAEEMIERGFRLDPKNINLLYDQAMLSQKMEDHQGIIESVQAAMQQKDTSDYYQMMLGVAYLKVDSVDQAIEHLEQIVAREEDSEHTHHYLGIAYRQKREIEKATAHMEKAVEKGISPKISSYYAELGALAEKQKKYKLAMEHYENAYRHSQNPEHLFHVAHNCDRYYKDKNMALRYYRKYLRSGNEKFQEYAQARTSQLKELLHFQK
ncbi:MAG: tetratricopeptide repeat protein [Saprospiraceae bacterium]|nr:tetratricopeptide repeat protein [Saprospiraceae bacterium]